MPSACGATGQDLAHPDAGRRRQSLTSLNRKSMTETKDLGETAVRGGMAPLTREKAAREVIIPDAITLQELAGRLSVGADEVVDALAQEGKAAKSTDTLD